jgi:hypothetical protein
MILSQQTDEQHTETWLSVLYLIHIHAGVFLHGITTEFGLRFRRWQDHGVYGLHGIQGPRCHAGSLPFLQSKVLV